LTAVLWSSDLRGFTDRTDQVPGNFDMRAITNRDDAQEILGD
jgi:hypothetical protein